MLFVYVDVSHVGYKMLLFGLKVEPYVRFVIVCVIDRPNVTDNTLYV